MKVFILFDPTDRAYPIVGIYSSLDLARHAARATTTLVIYEEVLDNEGEWTEPVFHPTEEPS